MNRVHSPRTMLVLGLNAGMGTASGADELVEIPPDAFEPSSYIISILLKRLSARWSTALSSKVNLPHTV